MSLSSLKVQLGVGVAVAGLSAAAGWYLQRCKDEPFPTEWLEVGHVEQLLVYPLKSGAALKCTDFICTEQGPVVAGSRDRVLAVIREDGSLVTGRDYPHLTQVSAQVKDDILTLSAGMQLPLDVNLKNLKETSRQNLKIWKCESQGVDCGSAAADYLSVTLGTPVRLLFFPDRQKGKQVYQGFLDLPFIRPTDGGVFSDAMSFHLVNQASVRDLNTRLPSPVGAHNFRPNIIVSGDKFLPYEEDQWQWIKIGNVVFRALAPCTRCLFTTVNPDNGEKSETFEPLKTLRKYRVLRDPKMKARFGSSPVMGVYLGVRQQGTIHAGDVISIPIRT